MNENKTWHDRAFQEALERFGSRPDGLTAAEAAKRLAADGPNRLAQGRSKGPWGIFASQFGSLIIWILIIAGALSGVLGQMIDSIAILAIVVLNACIGFYQEYNAEKSLQALGKMVAPQAKVVRNGVSSSIPASEIVKGDILALEAGDLVAADARLLESSSLHCVESALTGESEAVEKDPAVLDRKDLPLGDRADMVFLGTNVSAGTGRAVVVATGMGTELGRIAGLIEEAGKDSETPLQKKLDSFGKVLVWATLGIVAALFGIGLWRGDGLLEWTMTSISLAVAAVPEGLPAVVTVALSLGAMRMAKRRALVRKLSAVETLGSTSVICTDKTGTLTMGQMTVRELYAGEKSYEVTGEGYGPAGEVRQDGVRVQTPEQPLWDLVSNLMGSNSARLALSEGAWSVVGDPTEGAMLAAAAKAGGDRDRLEREYPKIQEFPFDSDRKRATVVRRMPNDLRRASVNGAPESLLALCTKIDSGSGPRPMTDADRDAILDRNLSMAQKALRVLGSAYRDLDKVSGVDLAVGELERDLVFVGLSGMRDPARPAAAAAVEKCRMAGIRVVMITGDHPVTATAVAREIGIASTEALAVTGADLDRMDDAELRRRVSAISVYARVTAAHKLRIVRAWKANGAVVAMTGDGVNDAPAIKGADIGIAMGMSGTEVTKQAADMVIVDDNFATIVEAVEQGRGIYDNIRKTLQYLLGGNSGELILMTVCVVAGLPSPLLAIHLLWINLVTDGLPALCLAVDPIDPDVMKRHPRKPTENITDRRFFLTMLLTGLLTGGTTLIAYLAVLRSATPELARSAAFAVLIFAELLRAFGARSETRSIWRIPFFANRSLVAVVAIAVGFQLWSQHSGILERILKASPMPFTWFLALLAMGAIPLAGLEIAKLVRAAFTSKASPTAIA